MIEVDKLQSFFGHMHSPWSNPEHSLIRFWVLHLWNFFRVRFEEA
jgi:hypothetical protein